MPAQPVLKSLHSLQEQQQTNACLTPVGVLGRCSALVELQLGGAGEGPEAAGAALQALTYYNRPARVAYLRELVQALLEGKNEACHRLSSHCM